MVSTAQRVRDYIDLHPSIKDGLRMGIVNLSALARRIMAEEGLESEDAVLIACRRYEVDPRGKLNEEAVRRILGRSKLDIRTKAAVLTVRPSWGVFEAVEEAGKALRGTNPPLHLVRGSEGLTLITDDVVADDVLERLDGRDVLKVQRGLVEVSVTSPEVVEEVPGIMAYLTTSLSSKGINFVEVLSCYKDTIFVVDKDDMMQTVDILNRVVSP